MDLAAWFQELRRRRVIRALLGWGLLSFAVLQVIEPLQHALGLGDWFLKVAVAVLATGFPVTAGLSWAFDITRSGVTRTAPAGGPGPPGVARAAPTVAIALAGAVIGAAVAGLAGWHLWGRTPSSAPDGRITVAVADFANETRDPDLDGLSGLLITSLEQSRKLRVLTRGRMIDLLRQSGKGDAPRIDEALARDLGRKAGVHALLVASIRRLGETYAVELRALDPTRDEYLFTLGEKATAKTDLLPLVDRLSDRVRERLKESTGEVSGSDIAVAKAITGDLEAYRHYFRGKERSARLDDDGAMEEFRRAIAVDPGFALAHFEIASWDSIMGRDTSVSMRRAVENADSLPVKERGIVRASAGLLAPGMSVDPSAMEALAARFPDDREVAFATGAVLGCRTGLRYFERALELAPDWDRTRIGLVYCLAEEGRYDEAIRRAEAAESARPTPSSATVSAIARFLAGDLDGAVAAARRAGMGGHTRWSRGVLVTALAARGDFGEASLEAARLPGDMRPSLAIVAAERGRLRECLALLDDFANQEGVNQGFARRYRGRVEASAVDRVPSGAERRSPLSAGHEETVFVTQGDPEDLAQLAKMGSPGDPDREIARALLARSRGDLEGARSILETLPRISLARYHRGLVAQALGRDAEAVVTLEDFVVHSEHPYWSNAGDAWLRARARLAMARSLDRLGRRDEARALLARQLDRWKDADRDLPLLAEMKALCKQMDCMPATRRP